MSSKLKRSSRPRTKNGVEDSMINMIDKLAEYEAFVKDIPKELRQAILDGISSKALYKKYENIAAVRVVQILMTEKDSTKALAAAKELLDRTHGKATEHRNIKHSLDELPDKELDALLLGEMSDVTTSIEDTDE